MPGLPCLQCFFTGACYGACGAAWSCSLVLRTLPRALRWAAFQRSQPEVRRGSQAGAVSRSGKPATILEQPASLAGGVGRGRGGHARISRCLLVSYMPLASLAASAFEARRP